MNNNKSPYDFSNEIDKLRIKLDYEKYSDATENLESYNNTNPYEEKNLQTPQISQKSLSNMNINTNSFTGNTEVINEEPSSGEYSDNEDETNVGGSKKVQNAVAETSALTGVLDSKKDGSSIGDKTMANLGGIAQYGMSQINMFQNEAKSEKEGWASFGSSIAGGAALGGSIGGPWGAAIGAGVGLITGTIDMIGDTKKRSETARNNYNNGLALASEKRKQDFQLKKGEEQIGKIKALRESQLNYLNLD